MSRIAWMESYLRNLRKTVSGIEKLAKHILHFVPHNTIVFATKILVLCRLVNLGFFLLFFFKKFRKVWKFVLQKTDVEKWSEFLPIREIRSKSNFVEKSANQLTEHLSWNLLRHLHLTWTWSSQPSQMFRFCLPRLIKRQL